MEIPYDDILKIIFAFAAGAMLGIEREYRDKPAGMRTIILITVGSALFSLLNLTIDTQSPDRIASTVVVGVGFVGGGVIFKEGINVHGITTAATIWVSAAIGMAIGFGNYWLAGTTLVLTLIALIILKSFEKLLGSSRNAKDFRFGFNKEEYSLEQLEDELKRMKIKFQRLNISRMNEELSAEYKLRMSEKESRLFYDFILTADQLKKFQERE